MPPDFNETNKYKAVIAIHGGGWHSLKNTPINWNGGWMANNVKYYAQKGYVGIVFSYRDIDFDENTDVGDILSDCHDALKYIATNFLFLDKENTLLMGDSAGGHIALCLSMCLPDDIQPAIIPNKIALYNPVTDCACEKRKHCANNAIKYSPVHNIKRIDSKILVMHGTKDTVVDIQDSQHFLELMRLSGNDISMIEIPGASHAFILFGYTAKEDDVIKALKLTDEYFQL